MTQYWYGLLPGIATLFLLAAIPLSRAQENPMPVFIHANCKGDASAAVLGSLKIQIDTSAKYIVVPKLNDNGRMNEVLEIYIHCTQRNNVVAIATSYGKGKCLTLHQCGSMIDGSSIKSTLCDVGAIGQCGKILFTSFDEYVEHSSAGQQAGPPASK